MDYRRIQFKGTVGVFQIKGTVGVYKLKGL